MSGVNKAIILGRLGKDPEERRLNSGDSVVSFSVATSENWKDKTTGEKKEKTEWHNIVIFNPHIGQIAMQYLKKGSQAYVEGSLQTRKWQDKDGNDKYTTEIVLSKFKGELTLLGGKPEPEESVCHPAATSTKAFVRSGADLDDEIPF